MFTFHIEATDDAAGLIKAIKAAGMKVGIAIKPKTPVDSVFPYVADVDLILVMTVEPGFGASFHCEASLDGPGRAGAKLLRGRRESVQRASAGLEWGEGARGDMPAPRAAEAVRARGRGRGRLLLRAGAC